MTLPAHFASFVCLRDFFTFLSHFSVGHSFISLLLNFRYHLLFASIQFNPPCILSISIFSHHFHSLFVRWKKTINHVTSSYLKIKPPSKISSPVNSINQLRFLRFHFLISFSRSIIIYSLANLCQGKLVQPFFGLLEPSLYLCSTWSMQSTSLIPLNYLVINFNSMSRMSMLVGNCITL